MQKISFDYHCSGARERIEVIRLLWLWKDLGTWNPLTEAKESNIVGEAIMMKHCKNVHVVNDLNVPLLCMGLRDLLFLQALKVF